MDNVRLDEAHPTEICKLLTNKTASEKAQIKSREIAKRDFKGEFANTQYGVRVEIIGEVKEININGQSGIELFAKAWRGDKQLGFGKDGSVEIERFRIFNPPILVDDPNGDIVRERTDEITGEVKQRKLKENPSEAIRQVIAHNVKLVGKDNGNIVKGKVGNTTSTFYPDANVEVDTVDGQLRNEGNATWAGGRNEANSDSAPGNELEGDKVESAGVGVGKGGDGRYNLYRNIYGFYTGATIGAGEDIASAIFSIYGLGNGVYDNINDAYSYLSVVHSAPASNTSLAVGDWDSFTGLPNNMTEGNDSGERKDLTTFIATAQYYNFTLNTTGVSWIGKGGTNRTWLGIAEGHDIQDQDIGAGTGAGKNSVGYSYFADTAGTTNDPKLVVVHSAPTTNPPTVTTSTATSVTSNSATLNGTVNANGLSTTAWFNYGITSGTYTGTSTTQSVSGSSNTTVSSDIKRIIFKHDILLPHSGIKQRRHIVRK